MSKASKWFPFKFKRKKKKAEDDDPHPKGEVAMAPRGQTAQGMQPFGSFAKAMMSDRFWRDPFALLSDVQRGIFDDQERFFGDFAPDRFDPTIDLVDEGSYVKLTAELPGLDRDQVELHVEHGMLVLEGEKRSEASKDEEGCYRLERYFGRFRRMIPLPPGVATDKAEATFEKGLLTVRFPKTEPAPKATKIPLK